MLRWQGLLLLLIFVFQNNIAADEGTGTIRGFVYEEETNRELPFGNVVIRELGKGAETNQDGFFIIEDVPAGTHTLEASFIGYQHTEVSVSVEAGETSTQNLYLSEAGVDLEDFEVIDERLRREQIRIGEVDIEPAEIDRVPAIGGEHDLAQYLQIIPGVTFSGDQGGQLYIRGGTPVQNKVLMDGMTVYNPFHSIGLFSVFDVDAVENIEVMTGGFGAEYGGRTSSVIDISMREGNRMRHKGIFSITPFVGKALLEGPIIPRDQGEGYSLSYIFSTRGSYLEKTSPVLYPYAGDEDEGLPYNFLDAFGKITFDSEAGNKVSLYGFNFADRVNFDGATNFKWDSYGFGTDFMFVPSAGSTIIDGGLSFSSYEVEQQEGDDEPRYSMVDGFEADFNLTYYLDYDRIEYGFDVRGFSTDFAFSNAAGRRVNQAQFTSEAGIYGHYHKIWRNWVFDPGLRIHYYASLGDAQFEPRLSAQYNFTNWLRANMSGGWYSQNLISTTSDRDVVNLFDGFLSAPNTLPSDFGGETIRSRLQKSRHILAGIEADLWAHTTISVEGYYKDFNQLINMYRNKIFDNRPEFSHRPIHERTDFIREEGSAYGLDFKVLFDQRPWYVWAVYSLGYIDRYDGLQEYNPHWDRRHNVDLLAGYRFGSDDSWEINARFNFGTGFPFTKTKGFYERLTFDEGAATEYIEESGELGIIYSDLNTGRLPDYHRLDMNLRKTFNFQDNRKLEVTGSVTNVYNRNNVFYFDRVSHERVDQLPIMPSLGLTYSY